MAIVKFSDEQEFCNELRSEIEAGRTPDQGIVRVTHLWRAASFSPNIHHLYVVATYSVEGRVTRLQAYCGDLWRMTRQDEPVWARAKATRQPIEEACQELQLEVRGGVVENPGQ